MRWGRLFTALAIAALPATADAACTNPNGVAGFQIYNVTYNVMQYCNGADWVNMGAPNSTVADGDKGDITVSSNGTAWAIDTSAVTNGMLAGAIALSKLSTSGTANSTTYLRGDGAWTAFSASISDGDKGSITVSSSGTVWTIDSSAVTNAMLAGSIALSKLSTTGTANSSTYLRGDGVWTAPPSGVSGSGTTNYIAKFTGSTALGSSLIFDDGTNVGIGTTTANSKLEVAGGIKVANDAAACVSGKAGTIRFTGGSPPWQYCDGSAWVPFRQPRCQNDGTGECFLDATRSSDDPQFTAANIRTGTNILGVTGTLVEASPSCTNDIPATCTLSSTRASGDPDFIAENIKQGVTILGVTGTYTGGTTPDPYDFTDVTNRPLNLLTAASSITITGITEAAAVAVSGDGNPQVRINGGAWGTSGAITNGQTLEVRLTSANAASTARSASITVGAGSADWSVTTESVAKLYNGVHTFTECTSAGGTVTAIEIGGEASGNLCRRTGTSCWGGWTRLNSWGTTSARTCTHGGCPSCTTSSHSTFQNQASETCSYLMNDGYTCSISQTCTANLTSVGCY